MSDIEPKKYSIPKIEQLETLAGQESLVIELPTLERVLGPAPTGEWAIELTVNKNLSYKSTAKEEKTSMVIDPETGTLTLDIDKFILRIWDKLVIECNPPELSPVRLVGDKNNPGIDSNTGNAILAFLYKYFKNRISAEDLEKYKKK